MNYNPGRVSTSTESRKRKDREGFLPSTSSKPSTKPAAVTSGVTGWSNHVMAAVQHQPPPPPPPNSTSNRLLAGFMAHEFLTKGTLLGQKFDKARAEAVPVAELKKLKQSRNHRQPATAKPHVYPEVAHVLKSNEVHIPGIVNPTQLARWIQM